MLTQYASPHLIEGIAYGGADPVDDPRWPESGARSRSEYGFWAGRACGMACLQMVLHHRDGVAPPLVTLARAALEHGAYVPRADGGLHGLVYDPFLACVRAEHGLDGEVHRELSLSGLCRQLEAGRMVMVSVHPEVRRPERPAPGLGGHLVLAIGCDADGVHLRNPSGHTEAARAAYLPWAGLEPFYAGRGVSLDL